MSALPQTVSDTRPDYFYLRQYLTPQYARLPAPQIEAYMDERFGPGSAQAYDEYLEGFFDDVLSTVKRVAPVVTNVAGGVVRGAMTGSSLGLPGIIGGAVAGGAGTALSSYGHGSLRDVGNVINTGMQVASQLTPQGRLGNQIGGAVSGVGRANFTPQSFVQQGAGLLGGLAGGIGGGMAGGMGGGAASQLFGLLGRPEVRQALASLNLGPAANRTVPVGSAGTPVPTTAILGLLQHLAGQALDEAAAESDGAESELQYMLDARGTPVGDPALDDDRRARVLALLDHAQMERLQALAQQRTQQQAWQDALAQHQAHCAQCGPARNPTHGQGGQPAHNLAGGILGSPPSFMRYAQADEALDAPEYADALYVDNLLGEDFMEYAEDLQAWEAELQDV